MSIEKVDRRVQKTQQLLGDALIALSVEKGFDNVTIRDITERANVAYITFFRHYHDKHDLLMQRIDQISTELEALAKQMVVAETPAYHETEGQLIFEHVRQHPDFYGVIANSSARKTIQNMLAQRIQQHLVRHELTLPAEIAAHHCAVSLLGLIEWWVEHKMPYPAEQMAHIYYQIIIKPLLAA